jgi:hypothetical protein
MASDKPNIFRRTFGRGKRFASNVVAAEEIKQNSVYVGGLMRKLVTPSTSDREETFAAARMRLNLTEADLLQRHKEFSIRFYIFFFFLTMDLVLMGWFAIHANYMAILGCFGFAVFSLAQMVAAAFRAAQIQLEELIDVPTWFSRRDLWIPGNYVPRANKPRSKSRDLVSGEQARDEQNNNKKNK